VRYAIYFVPAADTGIYRFGRSVLGYDCYTGEDVRLTEFPDPDGWRGLIDEPRRYGFHATLKAPFRLLPSCSEAQLTSAFFGFAELAHPVPRIDPEIRLIKNFAAIVPREAPPSLQELADRSTIMFDAFRAPMPAAERARRVAAGLSASEMRNLDLWGDPDVFDDFKFHMTLTGKIAADRRDAVHQYLQHVFTEQCSNQPVAIDRICLLRQDDERARFAVLCQAELGRSR
jgi:hypothetical protein